jgi:hypothetical protein
MSVHDKVDYEEREQCSIRSAWKCGLEKFTGNGVETKAHET